MQGILLLQVDGGHLHLVRLLLARLLEGEGKPGPGLMVERLIEGGQIRDGGVVDGEQARAGPDIALLIQRAAGQQAGQHHPLFTLLPVAPQAGGVIRQTREGGRAIAPGVGDVQLAGQLGQQIAEVAAIADAGQQGTVAGDIAVPVHPVHVVAIELLPGEPGDLVEGGIHAGLPAAVRWQGKGGADGFARFERYLGYFSLPHQGGEGGLLVETGQGGTGLFGKQLTSLSLAQIQGVALDLALFAGTRLFHQIGQLIIDQTAGEQGAGGQQLQCLPMGQAIGLEAIALLGRILFGQEVGLGGATAVDAEQVVAKRLAIGPQGAVLGRLPVEDAAILAPGGGTLLIAAQAHIDRLGLGVAGVDDGDLLLGRVGAQGERQMAGVGGEGEIHLVAGGVEAGGHQFALLVARQIQQVDGLAVHHEGELLAIGGEYGPADPLAGNGQQQALLQAARIAEEAFRIRLAQAIEGGGPLLFGEIDKRALLLGVEGARLLAGIPGQPAYPLPLRIDGKQVAFAHQDQLLALLVDQRLVGMGQGLALFIRRRRHLRREGQLARLGAAGIEPVELSQPGPDQIATAGGAEPPHRMALVVGELLLLAAGEIPLPDVEVPAALAEIEKGVPVVAPDRIAGGDPVFGQLPVLLAVKQPEAGDGEGLLVLAKGLIHGRHLVGQSLPVGAGQGGRQRQIGLQLAASHLRPVEGAALHPFGDEVVGLGIPRALAAQQQALAIRAEGLGQIGARVTGEAHHLPAAGRHHKDVFVAVEVGGKGEQLAIRRPDRSLAQVVTAGQRSGRPPVGAADEDAPLPGEGELLSIRGEGGLA